MGGQSALVRVQGACRALSFGRGACKALTRRGSVVQRAVRRACNGRAKRSAALRVGGGGGEGCIIPPSCRTWARVCPRVLGAVRGSSCKRRGPRANGGVPVQMEGSLCVCVRPRALVAVQIAVSPSLPPPTPVSLCTPSCKPCKSVPRCPPCCARVCVCVCVPPRVSSWPCKLWCPHTAVSSCKSQCHHRCPHVCPRVLVAVQIAVPPHRCPFMPTPLCPLARPRANHSAPHRCPRVWMSP